MNQVQYFEYNAPVELDCGAVLPEVRIAYHTYGEMNADRSNVIWVCHALTANSDVADWWEHTVEEGKFLDPARYFVVCANFIGSCYGSTGPLSVNPATGKPYYNDFPIVTVRDMVRCHRLLAEYLGIEHVRMLIGSSIGGYQCCEWAVQCPDFAERLVLIATLSHSTPWAHAFNESQRMAIECDPEFGEPREDAAWKGMATARSIALLSYRGQQAYDKTQQDPDAVKKITGHRATTYQRYQGEKLCRRFNVYSYHRLTHAVDSHNIARGRTESEEELLRSIRSRTVVIAISSDLLFPADQIEQMSRLIPNAEYHLIDSDFGHDGFLIEHVKLNDIIMNVLEN
ncbi:MAG: homoserine O-acetyltransferase [Rikenellaceae bacterium]|nr:homoserine O-acetyltransferase [Rikenellaceae bacterium]